MAVDNNIIDKMGNCNKRISNVSFICSYDEYFASRDEYKLEELKQIDEMHPFSDVKINYEILKRIMDMLYLQKGYVKFTTNNKILINLFIYLNILYKKENVLGSTNCMFFKIYYEFHISHIKVYYSNIFVINYDICTRILEAQSKYKVNGKFSPIPIIVYTTIIDKTHEQINTPNIIFDEKYILLFLLDKTIDMDTKSKIISKTSDIHDNKIIEQLRCQNNDLNYMKIKFPLIKFFDDKYAMTIISQEESKNIVEIFTEINCPICLEQHENGVALKSCGHCVCIKCVSKIDKCPICRLQI